MDPPPQYPGYVAQPVPAVPVPPQPVHQPVMQPVNQPMVVTSYPGQPIVTHQGMPPVQTIQYIPAQHIVQPQYVQQQTFIAQAHTQPAVVVPPPPNTVAQPKSYAATAPGIFKILEFISLLIAWACAARYKEMFTFEPNGRLKFFLAICILAWLLVMLFFIIFVTGVHKHCGGVVAAVLGAVLYGIFTLLLVICSGLMADDASGWRFYYKYLHGSQREYVNNLYAAVAFGFISAMLFFIDAVLFCADNANRANTPAAPTVVQQPVTVVQQPGATVVHLS